MKFKPKVSIVIPVYNGGNFLRFAIESALAQTYSNIEILVINDGSCDGGQTERIAREYGDRICYFTKLNGGVASALNQAIDKMSGDYFSWLSHDDLYSNDKVACQVDALADLAEEDRENTIVYSDFCVFSSDPDFSTPVRMSDVRRENFRFWLTTVNMLHGCTLLIPKEAFFNIGRFNETLRTTQDYDLWFRMAKRYRFVRIPELLVKARSHPEQGSVSLSKVALMECNALLSGFMMALNEDELQCATKREVSVAYGLIAESMWRRGFAAAGWSGTRLAISYLPNTSLRGIASVIKLILFGVSMHFMFKPIRKLVPPPIRLAIRTWFKSEKQEQSTEVQSVRNLGLKEKFSAVYRENIFGGAVSRSGEGSDMTQTKIIRREIPICLKELEVKSFLDAPCGDWYWMRDVDLPVDRYIGVDIVDALIDKNQVNFGNDKVAFICMNLADSELPYAELIFSRDCLVHLSYADSLKIISNFKRSGAKYLLTTTFTDRIANEDLGDGFWRPLNMQLAPFNFPQPLKLINEGCTEGNNLFGDKCLGLWKLQDIQLPLAD